MSAQTPTSLEPHHLGSAPVGARVRIGVHVGVVAAQLGAVTRVRLEEPEAIETAWFSPLCECEQIWTLPITADERRALVQAEAAA